MSSQLFKENIPVELLIKFLTPICDYNECEKENIYIFSNDSYKRSILIDTLNQFLSDISPYYHNSKRIYIERKMSFGHLATIIRQICKSNKISYKTDISYIGSSYQISYYITINNNLSITD